MSDNAKKKIRFLIGTELAVILCLVCIWVIRTATVGVETTKATVIRQAQNTGFNSDSALLPAGSVYSKPVNIHEAIQSYKEAIEANPNDFDSYFELGGCYSELGNEEEALKATKEAVRIRPDYPFAHIALGLNYYNLGRYEEAIETYKHAVELDPDLADTVQTLIGNAYAASGRRVQTGDTEI
jgi:tetratricopeptide (TPR) repeat protein